MLVITVCVCVYTHTHTVITSMQSACAVLYCHLWTVRLYHIFVHYLINDAILGMKLLNTK